jgi:hypothetical protein
MTSHSRATIIRAGKFVLAPHIPQEGDIAPRERTRLTRAKPAHDAALVKALFEDLALWREERGMRVRYLSLRELDETLETIAPKVMEVFAAIGIAPESLSVENAEKQEAHRGEVRMMMPEQAFNERTQQMKHLLREVSRGEEMRRVGP